MAPIDVVVPQPSTSPRPLETPPRSPPCTPPNNTHVQGSPLVGIMDRFEQGVMKLIQALEKVDATTKREDIESTTTNHVGPEQQKTRASKLEYKLVDEVYVPCSVTMVLLTSPFSWDVGTSKYKIVDSATLLERVTDLDEHVFVVRGRIGKSMGPWQYLDAEIEIPDKQTFEQVFYIDIKSDGLRDVLRIVLRDVRGLSLREDKVTVRTVLI